MFSSCNARGGGACGSLTVTRISGMCGAFRCDKPPCLCMMWDDDVLRLRSLVVYSVSCLAGTQSWEVLQAALKRCSVVLHLSYARKPVVATVVRHIRSSSTSVRALGARRTKTTNAPTYLPGRPRSQRLCRCWSDAPLPSQNCLRCAARRHSTSSAREIRTARTEVPTAHTRETATRSAYVCTGLAQRTAAMLDASARARREQQSASVAGDLPGRRWDP